MLGVAIQATDKIQERFFEPELHRLRGQILLALGKRDEAEAALRQALTIAQRQQARWWELRAATALARKWRADGRCLDAYSLLQRVYGWFVEGFDTASLEDAKALLGELRSPLKKPQARRG
jgi:predicted ATPase